MEQWKKIGKVISDHMAQLVLICVALGVLFPDVFKVSKPFVPYLFAFMTFQGSLNNRFENVVYVFKNPLNLIIILVINIVVLPVLSFLLSSVIFAGNANLITGATLEYCVPVAVVSFIWVSVFNGDTSLSLVAVLVTTVLSPFTIPATLQILLGATIEVDVLGMMSDMVFMIALPALVGMLVNEFTHGWGKEELSPVLNPAAKLVLPVIWTCNSTNMADDFRHLTPQLVGMAFYILAFATFGFFVGFAIARLRNLKQDQMIALCFCSGLRNISAGTVIATQYFDASVVFPVMMGTMFQSVLAGIFGSFIRKYVEKNAQQVQEEQCLDVPVEPQESPRTEAKE